jgi:hypothetical protein
MACPLLVIKAKKDYYNLQRHCLHLVSWLASKKLTMPNAGKDVKQEGLLFIADGNSNWYRHFGR